MTDADKLRTANPWHPIKDAVDLKHLGKLTEECGELASAASRCIIQGVDECEPVTGKSNRAWLEDEIADMEANIMLVKRHFSLDHDRIETRATRKISFLGQWHARA